MSGRLEMILTRVGLAVYLLLLSFLLLAPDPLWLLGFVSLPEGPSLRVVHFGLFTVLGFLAWASRWPLRPGIVVGLLVAYALGTETLQWFIPTRTVELWDYLENLLGLAAGWAAWRTLQERGLIRVNGGAPNPNGNDTEAPTSGEDVPARSQR